MSEDERTIFCGNLSEKVTDDVLYELFLQGGPLQKVNIPKDRDGKQRTFAFITYKHAVSVQYAISLFDGTLLHKRAISLKSRCNVPPPEMNHTEQNFNQTNLMQLGQQMLQCIPNPGFFQGGYPSPPMLMGNQFLPPPQFCYDERRSYAPHPYQREPERLKSRYNDHARDIRRDHQSSYRETQRDNSHRSHRHESNNRNEMNNRHESNNHRLENINRYESNNRHNRRYNRS